MSGCDKVRSEGIGTRHHRATTTRRSDVKRLALIITLTLIVFAIPFPAFAMATTDLNNIPITDTLEEGTFEWDVTGRYNDDYGRGHKISTRLFGALFNNFEFGMNWGLSRPAGPVSLSMKYKILDEYDGDFPVSLAVGVYNITGIEAAEDMDPYFYGVVGIHDVNLVGWWDWYLGYAYNPEGGDNLDNDSFFGGFKYWINEDLQFNADVMSYTDHSGDEDYFRITGGLNYDWKNHLGFQGWVERDTGTEDNVIVLQFVARADMRDLTAEVSDPE
jgi:hypothetical protein